MQLKNKVMPSGAVATNVVQMNSFPGKILYCGSFSQEQGEALWKHASDIFEQGNYAKDLLKVTKCRVSNRIMMVNITAISPNPDAKQKFKKALTGKGGLVPWIKIMQTGETTLKSDLLGGIFEEIRKEQEEEAKKADAIGQVVQVA